MYVAPRSERGEVDMTKLDGTAVPDQSIGALGDVDVSIVMPCLNEARTVGRCVRTAIEALRSFDLRGEVVVADNGSIDESPAIALDLGARVIHVEKRGYGNALRAGIEASRGTYVIMGDADASYDFGELGGFLAQLREGQDLVLGNRFRGGIGAGAMPWHHRYIGNPALTGILNLFFHSPIGDAHCGLRAIRKDAFERLRLRSSGMEFASEMVIRACLHGLKIGEIPIVLHPDGRDRRPHLRSFRDGWRHLRLLLILCPLWLFLVPAVLMTAGGVSLMIWLTPGPQPVGNVVLGLHTMLLGCLSVILGYQTLWMWACARVFGRTSGLLPATAAARLRRYLKLERGLLVGLLLLLAGLGMNGWLVYEWYRHDLGALDVLRTIRVCLWGMVMTVIGVQTIYGSFFVSMLDPDWESPPR